MPSLMLTSLLMFAEQRARHQGAQKRPEKNGGEKKTVSVRARRSIHTFAGSCPDLISSPINTRIGTLSHLEALQHTVVSYVPGVPRKYFTRGQQPVFAVPECVKCVWDPPGCTSPRPRRSWCPRSRSSRSRRRKPPEQCASSHGMAHVSIVPHLTSIDSLWARECTSIDPKF